MTTDVAQVNEYLSTESGMQLDSFTVEALKPNFARCRYRYDEANTRPGGYISGPTIMHLIDVSVWVAVFTRAGIVPMAVTWDLHVSFLRPAIGQDLVAEAKLLKFGRLSYASVEIYHQDADPDDPERIVAHATVTYAVPRPSTQGPSTQVSNAN